MKLKTEGAEGFNLRTKLKTEGGGGFNPRIKPTKSGRASAPEVVSFRFPPNPNFFSKLISPYIITKNPNRALPSA
jgi:hypothetical protein